MDAAAVGRRIEERRKEMDLTNVDMAKKLGCSPSHLSRVQNGLVKGLRYDTVREWAQILGVTPQWLAEGEGGEFRVAVNRLGADPDISRALVTMATWFSTSGEHDREKLRHILRRLADLMSRRDTELKEVTDRDLVTFTGGGVVQSMS
jgi:transcriptional regulator with XRE-family HTH domain